MNQLLGSHNFFNFTSGGVRKKGHDKIQSSNRVHTGIQFNSSIVSTGKTGDDEGKLSRDLNLKRKWQDEFENVSTPNDSSEEELEPISDIDEQDYGEMDQVLNAQELPPDFKILNFSGKYSVCRRTIYKFSCSDPFQVDGKEFVKINILGQSFVMHQIRKMIGLVLAVTNGMLPLSLVPISLNSPMPLRIPMAPGNFLILHHCSFSDGSTTCPPTNISNLETKDDGAGSDLNHFNFSVNEFRIVENHTVYLLTPEIERRIQSFALNNIYSHIVKISDEIWEEWKEFLQYYSISDEEFQFISEKYREWSDVVQERCESRRRNWFLKQRLFLKENITVL